jgi:tight adherence protein C
MIYLIFLFIIAAIALIIIGIWDISINQTQIRQRLPASDLPIKRKADLARYLAPIFSLSNLVLKNPKLKERVTQRLYAARIKITPAEFFSIKLVAMIALTLITYLMFNKIVVPAVVAACASGYIIPDFLLSKRISKRKQAVTKVLPEVVDLLSLCMDAGLDFTMSMDWIVKKTRSNPMIEELAFVLEEIKWGKPRLQALKDMTKRLDSPDVRSFVNTLSQAERMGTPVIEVLGMLCEDVRQQRSQRGERIALQAPMKMLIPLIFCILPVIGIVIAGPIILQFLQGGLFK